MGKRKVITKWGDLKPYREKILVIAASIEAGLSSTDEVFEKLIRLVQQDLEINVEKKLIVRLFNKATARSENEVPYKVRNLLLLIAVKMNGTRATPLGISRLRIVAASRGVLIDARTMERILETLNHRGSYSPLTWARRTTRENQAMLHD